MTEWFEDDWIDNAPEWVEGMPVEKRHIPRRGRKLTRRVAGAKRSRRSVAKGKKKK